MDNRTKKIQQIRSTFKNIRKTEVDEAVAALLDLQAANALFEFIPIMRECIYLNSRDPFLWKYVAYFDSFLTQTQFSQMMHMCMLDFYVSIMIQLNWLGAISEMEQAKIYRKYWVRRIDLRLYTDLRSIVYRQTGIDIDYISSVDAVQSIRNYYTDILRLSPQEILYFLPQIQQIFIPSQYNSYCLPSNQPNTIRQNYHVLDTSREKQGKYRQQVRKTVLSPPPSAPIRNKPVKIQPVIAKTVISEFSDLNVYPNNSSKNQPLPTFSQGKRQRYQSQQTNAGTAEDLKQYEQLRKIRRVQPPQPSFNKNSVQVHYDKQEQAIEVHIDDPQGKEANKNYEEELQKVKELIQKLHIFNQFECKECGLRTGCEQSLKEHTENHVKQRLDIFQAKEDVKFGSKKANPFVIFTSYFKTIKSWQQEKDAEDQTQTYWMSSSCFLKNEEPTIECALCGDKIKQRFVDDQWKLENVINAIINTSDESTELQINDKTQNQKEELEGRRPEKQPKAEKSKKCVLHLSCAQVLKNEVKNVKNWNVALQ